MKEKESKVIQKNNIIEKDNCSNFSKNGKENRPDFQKKVIQTINKYNLIQENDKIVVGVSGGPDSMCLLHVLKEIKEEFNFKIYVAHINHMIRSEAEIETKYVEDFCEKLNIQCFVKKVNVIEKSKYEKIGTEEAGRKVRYEFFEDVLNQVGANKIATAHNANDNAETVLMNIFRGTGTSGLKGIEPIRDGKFIRPIIECERCEIEKYCEENNLEPKIDQSNFENVYTRNKIRNICIPQIQKDFNPNIIKSLNKLSELVGQENEFIKKYSEELLEKELIISKDKLKTESIGINKDNNKTDNAREQDDLENCLVLDLKKFNELDRVIKNRIVLLSIEKVLGNTQSIEKIHVDDIVKLCAKNIGNKYLTPNKNIKVLVKAGKIYFKNC